MNRARLVIGFFISMVILGITLLTYEEGVENMLMGMVNAGTMPDKYLSSDGWVFDYELVEHFLMLSFGFTVLYYGVSILLSSGKWKVLFGTGFLVIYGISYVIITLEFWQMIGVTLIPMTLILAVAIYNLVCRE